MSHTDAACPTATFQSVSKWLQWCHHISLFAVFLLISETRHLVPQRRSSPAY